MHEFICTTQKFGIDLAFGILRRLDLNPHRCVRHCLCGPNYANRIIKGALAMCRRNIWPTYNKLLAICLDSHATITKHNRITIDFLAIEKHAPNPVQPHEIQRTRMEWRRNNGEYARLWQLDSAILLVLLTMLLNLGPVYQFRESFGECPRGMHMQQS